MSRAPVRDDGEASFAGIALDALEAARAAQKKADEVGAAGEAHEDICAERYGNINEKIGTLFKLLAWGGTTALMLILGLLSFLAKAQFDSITELKAATAQRVDLGHRMDDMPPRVIIQPAPGAATTGATVERQP